MSTNAQHMWLGLAGLVIVACATVLGIVSPRFGYDYAVADMPIFALVGGLTIAGGAFAVAAFTVSQLTDMSSLDGLTRRALLFVIIVGAAARLAFAFSEPMLEDDYQRYLWDGAVTVSGLNPYAVVPKNAVTSSDPALARLAQEAGLTLERVNHQEIRTIYPPGAQAFFALAHTIKPFSLGAWRGVVMAADAVTFALVLALLNAAGRSVLWSSLYWWNPIVIKELTNSVHMEAVLMPFILAAVWFAVRKRPWLATIAIASAGAVKIWPLALFPVLMRSSTSRWGVWLWCAIVLGGLTILWAIPMVQAGLDNSAGVVAYAEKWRTNSAAFTTLLWLADQSGIPSLTGLTANHVARGAIALGVVVAGVSLAWVRPCQPVEIIQRVGLVAIVIFLVSPAQFPWYVVWIAPFLPFLPLLGLIALSITMPLYYIAFHLMTIDAFPVFGSVVIWCVWFPVWALLMLQLIVAGPMQRGQAAAALTRRKR